MTRVSPPPGYFIAYRRAGRARVLAGIYSEAGNHVIRPQGDAWRVDAQGRVLRDAQGHVRLFPSAWAAARFMKDNPDAS